MEIEEAKDSLEEQTNAKPDDAKLVYFEPGEEWKEGVREALEGGTGQVLGEDVYEKHEEGARKFWDVFFKRNKTNFYKDRNYIDKEFKLPEKIKELKELKKRRLTFIEIGCAVGNTMFPISHLYHEDLMVYGFDFSQNAISYVKMNITQD